MKLKIIIGFFVSLVLCVPAFADDVLIKMTKQEFSRKVQSANLELASLREFNNTCNEQESKEKVCVLILDKTFITIISNTENEFVQAVIIKAEYEQLKSFLLMSSISTAIATDRYHVNGDMEENTENVIKFVPRLVGVFEKLIEEKSDKPSFYEVFGKVKLIYTPFR